jgi:hypothetical protein
MKRPSRNAAKPRLTRSELAQIDEKIADAADRLDQYGKSPADVIAFFKTVGSKNFDRSQWSQAQIWTSFELMCLCMFKAVQRGDLSPDPAVLIVIVLWYGDNQTTR